MTSRLTAGIRAPSTSPYDGAAPPPPSDFRQPADERRDRTARQRLLTRVRAEFVEVPGLCLTLPQGARLFGLTRETCARVFDNLIASGFLLQRSDGRYKLR